MRSDMRGGCTAVMASSVHANNRFGEGFLEDPFFHRQEVQKLQFVDQQMMFYPPSTGGLHTTGKEVGSNYLKREIVAPHVLVQDRIDIETRVHHRTRELGRPVLGISRNSWVPEESKRDVLSPTTQNDSVSPTAMHRLSQSSYVPSPARSMSPNNKNSSPEPRSVLDLTFSPRANSRHRARELGRTVLGRSRNAWVQEDSRKRNAQSPPQNDLARKSESPATHILSPSSSIGSPATSLSLDNKHSTPEPRSVLDFKGISPRRGSRYAVSSYDFTPSRLGSNNVPLDSQDQFLGVRRDASANVLSLDADSSQWEQPTNSNDCLQQTNQLWMDSLIEDLGQTPAQSPLPDLEPEGGDSPSSTPSEECNKSPSNDQEQSEEEETTNDGTAASEDSPTAQQVQSGCFRENRTEVPTREVGLELVNSLLTCAEAVSAKNFSLVNPLFAKLGELATPEGTSMQRVAAYFTEGLATRCSRLWPNLYQPLPSNLDLSEEDSLSAFHILNHVCPYTKFAHFTSNEIILQAFEGCDRVHVIDFDIKQGLQWPALFQSLAARPGGPPTHVRVTGVGECKEDVQDTGDRLAEFAEALCLEFEFHAVIDKLEDVRLWMLHVKEKEVVAVNCNLQLHRTLHDVDNGIKDMLELITSTKAKVVAVVEQEANHNGAFFAGRAPRFLESLQYYAAIFDSLDMNMPKDSMARMKVEQYFAREIRNIVACEGPERVERHENIETWRRHLDMGNFKSIPVSRRAKTQARLLLEMFSCKSYTMTEDEGALILGWRDRPLFSASAWTLK